MVSQYMKTIYKSPDGFCVAQFIADNKIFTARGNLLPERKSVKFDLQGVWKEDPKYGNQYFVETYQEVVPEDTESIKEYLKSGLIKGIGPKLADVIVGEFGKDTIKVLDNTPEMLKKISGIGAVKYKEIITSYQTNRSGHDFLNLMSKFDITAKRAFNIYQEMGNTALGEIKENPYKLCRYHIKFPVADRIAESVGMEMNSTLRISMGISFVLGMNTKAYGHLYMKRKDLTISAKKLLSYGKYTVQEDKIESTIESMINGERLFSQGENIYSKKNFMAEVMVCRNVVRLLYSAKEPFLPKDPDAQIREAEKELKISYSDDQKEALRVTLSTPINIITGYPGTGKTTILQGIIYILKKAKSDISIVLCGPTGRAARRMAEVTGMDACTIHKALGLRPNEEDEYTPNPVECDVMIVDESSMLDIYIAQALFVAIKTGTKVILIGDPDQLPSVKAGAVLKELIRCQAIPCTALRKIYRQNGENNIITNSQKINAGNTDLTYGKDFYFVKADNCDIAAEKIEKLYARSVELDGLEDVMILTPFRKNDKKTATESFLLNQRIQQIINPPDKSKKEMRVNGTIFRESDKVMQTKNAIVGNEDVNNGDIGYIERILTDDGTIVVNYGNHHIVEYEKSDDIENLTLAYAITIHKSQGSEFKTCIINLQKQHTSMLKRNLLYTAVSRAKRRVVLVGEKEAINRAIRTKDTVVRNTMLADRIHAKVKYLKKNNDQKGD